MLQRNMVRIDEGHGQFGGAAPSNSAGGDSLGVMVHFAIAFLRRQYWVVILVAALVMAARITYLRITPPTYTAKAQILFGNSRAQFLQQQSLLSEPTVDASEI